MLLYLLLIIGFGLLILVSLGMAIYSLVKKRKQTLVIAGVLFFIGTMACGYSVFMYSKRTIEYVKSEEFQNDAKKGSELIGQTLGSTTSGISNGIAQKLDDEAIRNLASKSTIILGKVTKTIASGLDSTIGNKNIYLDKTLENSGIEMGRADEKYNSKTNDLGIFIDYKKDFKGKIKITNYDQNGKKIDAVEKLINAKNGQGRVEVFSFSHSDLGLTTYYIISKSE